MRTKDVLFSNCTSVHQWGYLNYFALSRVSSWRKWSVLLEEMVCLTFSVSLPGSSVLIAVFSVTLSVSPLWRMIASPCDVAVTFLLIWPPNRCRQLNYMLELCDESFLSQLKELFSVSRLK